MCCCLFEADGFGKRYKTWRRLMDRLEVKVLLRNPPTSPSVERAGMRANQFTNLKPAISQLAWTPRLCCNRFLQQFKNPTRPASLPASSLQASQTASQQPAVHQLAVLHRARSRSSVGQPPAEGEKRLFLFVFVFTSFLEQSWVLLAMPFR